MANQEQLNRLIENSNRLITDSELLVEHGRHGSAFALAVLGLEEVGKAILLVWSENDSEQKMTLSKTYHVQKQSAVAHLLTAPLAIDHVIEDIAIPDLPGFVSDRFNIENHVEALARKLYESEEGRWSRHVEMGVIDVLKQISIYDDGSRFNIGIRSSDVKADSVAVIIAKTRRALELMEHELSMGVAKATYNIQFNRKK